GARQVPPGKPDTARARTPAKDPAATAGGLSQLVRSLAAGWARAVTGGRHRRTQWPQLLITLASNSNGWSAPQRVTVSAPGTGPTRPVSPAARPRREILGTGWGDFKKRTPTIGQLARRIGR